MQEMICKKDWGSHQIWQLDDCIEAVVENVPASQVGFAPLSPLDAKSPTCIYIDPAAGVTEAFVERIRASWPETFRQHTFDASVDALMILDTRTCFVIEKTINITDRPCSVCKEKKTITVICSPCYQFCCSHACFSKFHTESNSAEAAEIIACKTFFEHRPKTTEVLRIDRAEFEKQIKAGSFHVDLAVFCDCLKFKAGKLTPIVKVKQTVVR